MTDIDKEYLEFSKHRIENVIKELKQPKNILFEIKNNT